jgi:hypothetical protein
MSTHQLVAVHIPEIPTYLASSRKLKEYIESLRIGAVSHIDIVKREDTGISMAFVHFKCQWNNGEVSNLIRKSISERGFWEENIGGEDIKQIRLIKSDGPRGKTKTTNKDTKANKENKTPRVDPETKEQYELIFKLDSVKIESQSALIAQLRKELKREREQNHVLEQKLDVYKAVFGAVNFDELDMGNVPKLLNLDDLLDE